MVQSMLTVGTYVGSISCVSPMEISSQAMTQKLILFTYTFAKPCHGYVHTTTISGLQADLFPADLY